jgi:DNA invertase Pin-like site-specific DNA recombinase
MKIGALYVRVSTHNQDELSPDAQIRLGKDFAKRNDIVIPKEYIFMESVSGRKAEKRHDFQRMVGLAKSKPRPFDVIIVWKYSRFARNQEESIVYKSLLRKQCGIDVLSVSEPRVEGPFGSLIERIIEWMDEYYSIRLSGEVTRGMTEKALRGGFQARPPLGYKITERGKPPVIVPEEAKIIRLIFQKYVEEQCGFFDIAKFLNRLGYKTSRNEPFERRSIEYIIQNPTYCGMIRWNRTTNETNEIKDESEWIIADGQHEAIISKELFDRAQERFKTTYKPKGARPSSTYHHWLSGLLKCPVCGRTMVAKTMYRKSNGEAYSYFVCYGVSKGKCAAKNSVSSLVLEPAIIRALQDVFQTREIEYTEIKPAAVHETIDERELLMDQLKQLDQKEKRIKEAYRDGIDTLEEYKDNKEYIRIERERLEIQLNDCQPAPADDTARKEQLLNKIHTVCDVISSEKFTDQQKNEALKSIIQKIIYDKPADSLKIYYYLTEP